MKTKIDVFKSPWRWIALFFAVLFFIVADRLYIQNIIYYIKHPEWIVNAQGFNALEFLIRNSMWIVADIMFVIALSTNKNIVMMIASFLRTGILVMNNYSQEGIQSIQLYAINNIQYTLLIAEVVLGTVAFFMLGLLCIRAIPFKKFFYMIPFIFILVGEGIDIYLFHDVLFDLKSIFEYQNIFMDRLIAPILVIFFMLTTGIALMKG